MTTRRRGARFRELSLASDQGLRMLERRAPRFPVPAARAPLDAPAFHAGLPGYCATPLAELTALAEQLGIDRLWIKDESSRFGLPAFKFLGASWAAFLALSERFDLDPRRQRWPFDELGARASAVGIRLTAATDGNHGRALARAARLFRCSCSILVPAGTAMARIKAIEAEGAAVQVCDGSYDDAVDAARAMAEENVIVVADTSWDGYERIPRWVSDGYRTIFHEVDAQVGDASSGPDIVLVQVGVGALASAVIQHYAQRGAPSDPLIVVVEPVTAACAFASAEAGRPTAVPGPHPSIMAGLNAGHVSQIAAPLLDGAVSAYCAVSDELACEAVRMLAAHDIVAGETGAAGLAGLLAMHRRAPNMLGGIGRAWRRPLLFVTEGVTDPVAYQRSLAQGRADSARSTTKPRSA